MRDLLRNPKDIKKAVLSGQSFLVFERRKPVFKIVPNHEPAKNKYTLNDLKKLNGFIKEKAKLASKSDDEIVYGI